MLKSINELDWRSGLDHANSAFAVMVGGQRFENITREEAKLLANPNQPTKRTPPEQG